MQPPGECYCCGKRHPGGYLECTNLNDIARDRMTRMVEAGYFDTFPPEVEKKPTRQNLRKGTALVAVEDESKSEGEDEKSALPNLEELLRKQGYIQLNVYLSSDSAAFMLDAREHHLSPTGLYLPAQATS